MYQQLHDELRNLSQKLIEGCRARAYDGTWLYTPDGISSYNALWLRDFSYMVEYAGFAIPNEEIEGCIRYAIRHRREDGWMPDRACGDGTGVYAAGEMGHPIGEANLDNTPFLVFTVYDLSKRLDAEKFKPKWKEWEPHLTTGLKLIPLSGNGLVYNDPKRLHSPYGFTDTVAKSGELFMESLLFWRACKQMAELSQKFGTGEISWYEKCMSAVEETIGLLRDKNSGGYFAASGACKQLDIWGMAYLLFIDFPVSKEEKQGILSFLKTHYENYMYCGQVRHLLKGEYWQALLIDVPEETYQNGAYWATASGWVIGSLAEYAPELALRTLREVTQYFQEEGSFECVNEGYQKLPSFVVSAANVYGGIKQAAEIPAFRALLDQKD